MNIEMINTPNMERFPTLIMTYAEHILEGKRTIDRVPLMIREDVRMVVEDALSKRI